MKLFRIYITSAGVGILAGLIIGNSQGDSGPFSALVYGAIFFAPIMFTFWLLSEMDKGFRHGFGLYDLLEGACWMVWSPLAVVFGIILSS
jgi:hypothetical protein